MDRSQGGLQGNAYDLNMYSWMHILHYILIIDVLKWTANVYKAKICHVYKISETFQVNPAIQKDTQMDFSKYICDSCELSYSLCTLK